MEQIRVFIALNVPVGVLGEVQAVQKALRAAARRHDEALSWVPASNMHITLKFLGDLPRARALAIRDRLASVLEGRESFALSLGGVGVFPDEARPRVLWLGVGDEGGQLAHLVAAIESGLDDLGFPKETRPYHAHVTLGRFKRGSTPPPFWQDIEAPPRSARGCEVVLYQSELRRAGAEYTALARFALSPASVDAAVAPDAAASEENAAVAPYAAGAPDAAGAPGAAASEEDAAASVAPMDPETDHEDAPDPGE